MPETEQDTKPATVEETIQHMETISGQKLKAVIVGIESLIVERQEINDQIKEILANAKADGYEPKIIKKVLALRKLTKSERDEQNRLVQAYSATLGL